MEKTWNRDKAEVKTYKECVTIESSSFEVEFSESVEPNELICVSIGDNETKTGAFIHLSEEDAFELLESLNKLINNGRIE